MSVANKYSNKLQPFFRTGLFMAGLICLSTATFARGGGEGPPPPDTTTNPLAITLIIIIGALALLNIMLAWILNGAAGVYLLKNREKKSESTKPLTALLVIGASFLTSSLYAQDTKEAAVIAPSSVGGLSNGVIVVLIGVI